MKRKYSKLNWYWTSLPSCKPSDLSCGAAVYIHKFVKQVNDIRIHELHHRNLTSTCWHRHWRSLQTKGPGSKHSALCLHPWPPLVVLGCHGDGGPFGTSGWSLGPSFFLKRGKCRKVMIRRRNTRGGWNKRVKSWKMTEWDMKVSLIKLNGRRQVCMYRIGPDAASSSFITSLTVCTKLNVPQQEIRQRLPTVLCIPRIERSEKEHGPGRFLLSFLSRTCLCTWEMQLKPFLLFLCQLVTWQTFAC